MKKKFLGQEKRMSFAHDELYPHETCLMHSVHVESATKWPQQVSFSEIDKNDAIATAAVAAVAAATDDDDD